MCCVREKHEAAQALQLQHFEMVDDRSIGAFSARGRARLYRLPKKSLLTARQESTPGLAGDGGAT
jgi:hypothetical protein